MKEALLIGLLLLIFNFASASSLGVWPINPRIDSPASSTMVWVKNNNKAETVVLQARVFIWQQVDNLDQLIPQDDLVVSPPIIEVKPNVQQIFRIMNRSGEIKGSVAEKSYRLLIDEIPKEEKASESVLQFQMRYSLPLFVGIPDEYASKPIKERLKKMEPNLHYKIIDNPNPSIEIANESPLHARLSNLTIHNQLTEKKVELSNGLLGYILPNSVRNWPLSKDQYESISNGTLVVTFEQEHQGLIIAAHK